MAPEGALIPILSAIGSTAATGIASSIAANKKRDQQVEDITRYNVPKQTEQQQQGFSDQLAQILAQNQQAMAGGGQQIAAGSPIFDFSQVGISDRLRRQQR